MLDELCQAYMNHAGPLGVILKYKRVTVLVIDDWDKAKMSYAKLDYLYQIIDYRYTHELQTIVTTNVYDMRELKLPYWCTTSIEPLMSRLLESGDWVTIRDTENYRLKKTAVSETEPEPEVAAVVAEPEAPSVTPDRVGKISLTERIAKPITLDKEAETLAEFASQEYKLAEKTMTEDAEAEEDFD